MVKVKDASILQLQRLESLGALAAGIAHDLNNVLTPVSLAVGLLRSSILGENQRLRLLDTIQLSVNRASELLQQVVHFAQDQEVDLQVLDPASILDGVRRMLQRTLPQSIQLELQVEPGLGRVLGDGTQLSQVLLRLAVSARDAMPLGGVLTLAARSGTLDPGQASPWPAGTPGHQVLLSITTRGCGPSGETSHPLFTPFSASLDPRQDLAGVLGIVHRHRGFLEVECQPDQGLTFRIGLPVTSRPANATPDPLTATEQLAPACGPLAGASGSWAGPLPGASGSSGGALLVDDEPAICSTLRTTLETHGYRVWTAHNGAEALSVHRQHGTSIDVVIIDLMMPVLDGSTAIQTILERNDRVRIIATSGLTGNAIWLPISPRLTFLPKPFNSQALLRVLTEVLPRSPN